MQEGITAVLVVKCWWNLILDTCGIKPGTRVMITSRRITLKTETAASIKQVWSGVQNTTFL